jgi:hypothetical protein
MQVDILNCPRCALPIHGWESNGATAGFYYTHEGTYWNRYANRGEDVLCDECMFRDPSYRWDYGVHYKGATR